jgi:5-(hydroxymethyl)furfural/furfural oxidase
MPRDGMVTRARDHHVMARVLVVGAGSSGAALAGRLAAAGVEVVLVEAGPAVLGDEVPAGLRSPNPNRALEAEEHTWPSLRARRTAAQEPYRYWRGRGLGGTSSVNGQLAIRPGPEAFDAWPLGWRWADVLPYFIRLEDDVDFGDEPYHGRGGPIPIRRAPLDSWEPVDLALRAAALDAGHPACADHNSPGGTGVSPFAANLRGGRRVSTADAYLHGAPANLTIVPDTLVDRVQLAGGRATGVIAADGQVIEADRVVIAAGAIHSPAILQRSGIGPADAVLRPLGIDVVADLPVGATLMEHPIAYCVLRLSDAARASSIDARYTNVTVRCSSGLADGGRNDLMLIGNNLVGAGEPGRGIGIVGVALEASRSTGRVCITTGDPTVDPDVELGMLDDADDLARLRHGIRRVFELLQHDALQSIAVHVSAGRSTALDAFDDDDALDEWLIAECIEGNHAAASCPMGEVLDRHCQVFGVDDLFVVDASAFPTIPPANPHLTAVMLGEAMADRLAPASTLR